MKDFSTIYIDPPWPEKGAGKIKRGADRHYKVLKVDDIPREILTCPLFRPAPNSHMYLWATDNYLPDAIWVMRQIGFKYIRPLPWIKLVNEAFELMDSLTADDVMTVYTPAQLFEKMLKMGIGQYFRGCSELLLFGVKGKGKHEDVFTGRKDLKNVIIGPRGKHSKKPDRAYEIIEARSKGPYLEIFARSNRPGWTAWGKEAPSV